ncbi:MAG: hypothetical protein N2201_03020 [candidate division WOR-3 bacterium]|nr:hypothetical protein [candidate division WOR-3 bacterium]
MNLSGPIWLMQPIPYFGEKLKGQWIIEPKIDGWRMQIIKYSNGRIECWGRRLEKRPNWSNKLSFLNKALLDVPNGSLLDCELFSSHGRRFIPSLFAKKPKAKPIIYVFDIIYYKNKFIGNLPLKARKRILKQLPLRPPLSLIEYKDFKGNIEQTVKLGQEGIVLKELNSQYQVGTDAPLTTLSWRKIKWQ